MAEAFEISSGKVTPALIGFAVPWDEIKKCVVVFENEHGDLCSFTSQGALDSEFLSLAELQIQNLSLFGRPQKTCVGGLCK